MISPAREVAVLKVWPKEDKAAWAKLGPLHFRRDDAMRDESFDSFCS